MTDVPHATLNQHESVGLPEGKKGQVRETGRTNFCLASGKDPSYYVCTEPTFLGLPPQHTSYIAACEACVNPPCRVKVSIERGPG